ncbi:methyl-accepting chemotaxis protein, partial [bacterium]|nr:methyl-accepting chemotaxis protein [bacterium]
MANVTEPQAPKAKAPAKSARANGAGKVKELEQRLASMEAEQADTLNELGRIIKAVKNGQLNERAEIGDATGVLKVLREGVNEMLDALIAPINMTVEYVDAISKGEIPERITEDYQGDFNEIKNSLNACIDVMNGLLKETDKLVQATAAGKLETRGDADSFAGGWGKLLGSVNDLVEAVAAPIDDTARVMRAVAQKDLTSRITKEYQGQFGDLKNYINAAVENMDEALSQVNEASDQVASASGQISTGSQALAEGANEQASALEEVSSSLEQMAAMTKQNADNAGQGESLANGATDGAKKGVEAMNRMSSAMDKIKTSSGQTAKIIK